MTTRPLAFAVALTSLLLVAAQADKPMPKEAPPPPPVDLQPAPDDARLLGSCTVDAKSCLEWEGAFTGVDLKARCQKAKGTWSDGACPTENRVGTCTQRETSSDDRTMTRSFAPVKAADAKAACKKLPRAAFMPN
jgi:hypothetical protein